MDRILPWIRENPAIVGIVLFLSVTLFLGVVLSVTMLRAGSSLRPLVWFFGFLAIVAGPQGTVHLLDALAARRGASTEPAPATTEPKSASLATATSSLKPIAWEVVFGPDADPSLITDAKLGLSAILGDAQEAKLSFNVKGESALAARFASPEAAMQALNKYGGFFQFTQASGSDGNGWTARRFNGQGEWNHVVAAGNELYAWTAAARESVVANRVRALGALTETAESAPPSAAAAQEASKRQVSNRISNNKPVMFLFLAINLIAAVLWFFKGSTWAARADAQTGALPAPLSELRTQLLALNEQNLPARIELSPDGKALEVNWRYADARWFDLMRVHQMRKTHKLVLRLDENARTVRVREYWSAFDASAGPDALKFNWQFQTGIQFFAYEHKRVIGVQLGPDGKPTGELSKAYTFNLQELKNPISDAVTRAGWTWQPLVYDAPRWLHWLTE